MKKILLFFAFLFIIISCNNKKNFIGHWHEFKNVNNQFGNCIIINDSTFSINKFTTGRNFEKYKTLKEILTRTYYDSLIHEGYSLKKEELLINDSIKWIKQKENTQTFLNDFSAGLKIKIEPIIRKHSLSDSIVNFDSYIFIGKSNKRQGSKIIEKNKLYFQLNEKMTRDKKELLQFLICNHCDINNFKINIISDKSITKAFIDTICNTMKLVNIKINNVYFQYLDTITNKIGFKNINEY